MSKRLFFLILVAALMAVTSTTTLQAAEKQTGKALVIGRTLPGGTDTPLDPNFADDQKQPAATTPVKEDDEAKLPLDHQVKNLRGRVTDLENRRDQLLRDVEAGKTAADDAKAKIFELNKQIRTQNGLIELQLTKLQGRVDEMNAERDGLLKIAESGGAKAEAAKTAVAALDLRLKKVISGLKKRVDTTEADIKVLKKAPGASDENFKKALGESGVAYKNEILPKWVMYLAIAALVLALLACVKTFLPRRY